VAPVARRHRDMRVLPTAADGQRPARRYRNDRLAAPKCDHVLAPGAAGLDRTISAGGERLGVRSPDAQALADQPELRQPLVLPGEDLLGCQAVELAQQAPPQVVVDRATVVRIDQ